MLDKIRTLAKAKGKTLVDVERDCKLGQRSIYNWNDHVPSADKVKRVADYLGTTMDELMRGDDSDGRTDCKEE